MLLETKKSTNLIFCIWARDFKLLRIEVYFRSEENFYLKV
jgi:hypothetical protein